MKKKIFFLVVIALLLTACGINSVKINGNEIVLDKQYKDNYITYKYPSSFKENKGEEIYAYPLEKRMEYEYYEGDKLVAILRVEELTAGISFLPMDEDAEKLEKDSKNKNINHETIKVNGKNLVKYLFNRDDDFGENTIYHVYYGGYSYMGINEFFKIYFISSNGVDDFEKAFISSFKINR